MLRQWELSNAEKTTCQLCQNETSPLQVERPRNCSSPIIMAPDQDSAVLLAEPYRRIQGIADRKSNASCRNSGQSHPEGMHKKDLPVPYCWICPLVKGNTCTLHDAMCSKYRKHLDNSDCLQLATTIRAKPIHVAMDQ